MSSILKNTKFLFPGTNFIINWMDKKLWEITDRERIDWSDHVINWEPFLNIIRSGYEKEEKLMLNIGPDNHTLVFYNFTIGAPLCVVAENVIQNKSLKEEEKMDEGKNRELTPEERIEQLEKEKAELQLQIKNQAKYDEMRKAGDELALAMKALQDSGFSREEAMQIFTITFAGSMIPPFLRR